ncbi:cellulose biosynthesis protein BcsQ [Streptomyces ambofaciens]
MPGAAVRVRGSVRPLEAAYDVIIVDCPPGLGIAMDAALYCGRRRRGEAAGGSGVVIPVLAEDSSATAYGMLAQQIEDLCEDLSLDIDYLGLVVNLYDSRRGYVATSSQDNWKSLGDPKVLAIIGDLKEQREAVCSPAPSSFSSTVNGVASSVSKREANVPRVRSYFWTEDQGRRRRGQ